MLDISKLASRKHQPSIPT